MWDTELSDSGESISDDGWEPTYGVGVGVHFGSLGVRAESETSRPNLSRRSKSTEFELEFSTITLSVTYTFL